MQLKILSLLLFTIVTGCKSTQPTALDHSLSEYQKGQWLLSEMWAKKSIEANESVGESQYMLGLCEFQRQHLNESQEWFMKASTSTNKEVHGKATAMLGIVSSNKGDIVAAEAAFAIAATELQGEDRKEATKRTTASTHIALSNNTYTLQFGAFKDRTNANTAVSTLSPSLIKAGIHSVWITEDIDRTGKTLYLVQAGHFPSRSAASSQRKNGDLPHCIVTVTD